MRQIPLFPHLPRLPINCEPLATNHACTRCALHARCKTVCMTAEGEPGGLLIVSDYPGVSEDRIGRPFVGDSGRYMRAFVEKLWDGPVALDNALHCAPGAEEITDVHLEACRPYLADTLRAVSPTRIVALGTHAINALTGRSLPVMSVREGYGWWWNEDELKFIPIFYLPNPAAALRNRFVKEQFEHGLARVLRCSDPPTRFDRVSMLAELGDDPDVLAQYLSRNSGPLAFDTETSGLLFSPDFQVVSITFAGDATSLTFDGDAVEAFAQLIVYVLHNHKLVGHNVKYDLNACRSDRRLLKYLDPGTVAGNVVMDTRIQRKYNEGATDGSLEVCAELVGLGGHKEEAHTELRAVCTELTRCATYEFGPKLTPTGKPKKPPTLKHLQTYPPKEVLRAIHDGAESVSFAYKFLNPEIRARYNARDSHATYELFDLFENTRPPGAWNPHTLFGGVIAGLSEMESSGIGIDKAALINFINFIDTLTKDVLKSLAAYDPALNWSSPVQVSRFFYDVLGLPQVNRLNPRSTDEETLTELAKHHKAAAMLLELRRLTKLTGTYGRGLLPHIRPDGRIHPSFLIAGAETWRLSSSDPNMQNAPRAKQSREAKMLRDCFCAGPGNLLVEVDYQQVELVIGAILSGDPKMLALFNSGQDFHRATARMIAPIAWKITHEQWDAMTKEQQEEYRSKAKTVNFTMFYELPERLGKTVAHKLECTVRQGEDIANAVFGQFTVMRAWMQKKLTEARMKGYTEIHYRGQPLFRRPLPAVADNGADNNGRRENAERSTWNSDIQGTAGLLAQDSLADMYSALEACGLLPSVRLCLNIHDSFVADVPLQHVDKFCEVAARVMCSRLPPLPTPLRVDFKVGKTWGSMQSYTPNSDL